MKEVFSEVFLHMAVFLVFILTLYFTFAVWIQQRAMVRDIDDILNEILNALDIPSINLSSLSQISIPTDIFSAAKRNRQIIILVSAVTPIVTLTLLGGAYYLAPHCFMHNLINSLAMLPFMLATELIVIGVFIYTYMLVDLNTLFTVAFPFLGGASQGCNYIYNALKPLLTPLGISQSTFYSFGG